MSVSGSPRLTGMFGLPYVFATDFEVGRDDQRRLIDVARKHGQLNSTATVKGNVKFMHVRTAQAFSLPERTLAHFIQYPEDWEVWTKYMRLDPDIRWDWAPGPASSLVQKLIQPIGRLFKKLTRVRVTLLVPGKPLLPHRDLALGNVYDDMRSGYAGDFGKRTLAYRHHPRLASLLPAPHRRHQQNLFLSAKIPLSERGDEPGRPFIIVGGVKYYYSSRNRIFLLNEVEVLHGADPVDYWRGLVNLQGILDVSVLRGLNRVPCRVVPAGADGAGLLTTPRRQSYH